MKTKTCTLLKIGTFEGITFTKENLQKIVDDFDPMSLDLDFKRTFLKAKLEH